MDRRRLGMDRPVGMAIAMILVLVVSGLGTGVVATSAEGHWPTVGVNREGAGDAEVVVGLHHHRRKPNRIELLDHDGPTGASSDSIDFACDIGVQPGLIEGYHSAVSRQALSTHRVPRRTGNQRPTGRACVGNRCANALSYCLPPIVSDGHVRRDGRRRQFARVVQNRRGIDRTVGVGRRK